MSTAATKFAVNCSFCNKDNGQVKKLIAGPGVYICDECIGLCNTILEDEAKDSGQNAPAPSLDEAPVDQLLMILGAMARTASSMEERLGEWTRKLAQRGVAISVLAAEVGMTEGDAKARFNL